MTAIEVARFVMEAIHDVTKTFPPSGRIECAHSIIAISVEYGNSYGLSVQTATPPTHLRHLAYCPPLCRIVSRVSQHIACRLGKGTRASRSSGRVPYCELMHIARKNGTVPLCHHHTSCQRDGEALAVFIENVVAFQFTYDIGGQTPYLLGCKTRVANVVSLQCYLPSFFPSRGRSRHHRVSEHFVA